MGQPEMERELRTFAQRANQDQREQHRIQRVGTNGVARGQHAVQIITADHVAEQPNLRPDELLFVVREPFRSQRTQCGLVAGRLRAHQPLHVESLMPSGGVIFSDGVEADFLRFNAGSVATIGPSQEVTRLVQRG